MTDYYDKYQNFQTFSTVGIDDGYDYIAGFLNTAADILIENGVYYADKKMLANKYGEAIFHGWDFIDASVSVKQDQAQTKVEAERQAREYRKASRGRMVVGGFGVKGAVKGMAMAGTYNLASGLLHSGANAIGNSISRSRSQKELQNLYENELRESVSVAIKTCVQVIGVIIIAELGLDVPDGIEERVTTLFNNFSKVPKEDQPVVAAQIITLAPWDARTYMLLLPKFGDPDGELYKLAKQASPGMLISFNSVRKDVLTKTIRSIQPEMKALVNKTSVEDLGNAEFVAEKERLLGILSEKARWLGCKPGEDLATQNLKAVEWEISKLCREKDEASRTVNGVVYKTRELAGKARENRLQAQKLVHACAKAGPLEICDILKKIRAINDSDPVGAVSNFVRQVEQKDIEVRTVCGVTYDTYELAQKAYENRKSGESILKSCDKANYKGLQDAIKKVTAINQSEPSGTVSDYIEHLTQKVTAFRTVAGVIYATYELAVKAKVNRDTAQGLIRDCKNGAIENGKLLQNVFDLNKAEPQNSVSDLLDGILIQFYNRPQDLDTKIFNKTTYKSVADRQTVECEYHLFFCKYSLASSTSEEFASKLDQADLALKTVTLDPLTYEMLERHLAQKREEINVKNTQWQGIRKKQFGAIRYVQCLGIFALIAMIILPNVKIHEKSCNLLNIIAICLHSDNFSLGCIALIGIHIMGFILIAKGLIASFQDATAIVDTTMGITLFVALTIIVCLAGGSAYNVGECTYVLVIGLLIRICLQKGVNADRKNFERHPR